MRRLFVNAVITMIALTGMVVSQTATAGAAACPVSAKLVNPCRPWLGASAGMYPGVPVGLRPQIEAHEQRIGRRVDIVHSYHPPGNLPLSADEKYFAARPNTMLFINWKPAARWSWAAGGNAPVDAQIDQVAARIAALAPHKVFLTLFHEPENDVSAGNCTTSRVGAAAGSPTDYRAMWRNVRSRFDAHGATNVVWVMDYMNYRPWDCLVPLLYPGNDLVDWVMFNAYGGYGSSDYAANVNRFYDLLTRTSDAAHDYLAKPWGIVEWNMRNASAGGGVSYYRQAEAALDAQTFPRLKAYMVFDNVGPEGNENRVAYDAGGVFDQAKQDAYNAFANDPALTGGGVPQRPVPPVTTQPVPPAPTPENPAPENPAPENPPGPTPVPTPAPLPDATPTDGSAVLTAPPGLTAAPLGATAVGLSWAPMDGAAGYHVYRDGGLLATIDLPSYADRTVTAGSTHSYEVEAFDSAGNVSARSPSATTTTPGTPAVETAPAEDQAPAPVVRSNFSIWPE